MVLTPPPVSLAPARLQHPRLLGYDTGSVGKLRSSPGATLGPWLSLAGPATQLNSAIRTITTLNSRLLVTAVLSLLYPLVLASSDTSCLQSKDTHSQRPSFGTRWILWIQPICPTFVPNNGHPVTSSRTGFRVLASLPYLSHVTIGTCLRITPSERQTDFGRFWPYGSAPRGQA